MRSQGLDFARSTVLDVGSGTGFFVEQWKELGVQKVVGVDLSDTSVANLRRKFPDTEFHQMDVGSDVQGRWHGAFDAVSSFDVLYHIVDDERYVTVLGNIYSFLRPGGTFIWSDNFVHEGSPGRHDKSVGHSRRSRKSSPRPGSRSSNGVRCSTC